MSMPVLVDSHCHLDLLNLKASGGSLEAVLDQAAEQGVAYMLCVSVNLPHLPRVLALAESHDRVFASVGIHPNEKPSEQEPSVADLAALAAHPRVVAIGETGLDYFRSEGDLEWQRARFRRHIKAARETGKPLIIHTRQARSDTLDILEEEGAHEVGGVLHCFSEDWETAKRGMEMNFMVSFSGIVTFNNAKELQQVAARIPLERILVETDAPWLSPVPHRGKPNQPAYVRHVAEYIAMLRETSLEEIARTTTDNFFGLFKDAHPGVGNVA